MPLAQVELTFNCLYCSQQKPASESSDEHAVPQFLGGAHAPSHYRLRNVCRACNNNLGTFVDGSYAKSWFVTNALAEAARKYYCGPAKSRSLPLTCIGTVNIPDLQTAHDQVAESWLGPSGESIIWVRSNDEAKYWYAGGDPLKRKHPSTVYFMPVSDDPIRWQMGVESLNEVFKKTKARRILGATVVGLPPGQTYPRFDQASETDVGNVQAIRAAIHSRSIQGQLRMNLKFDQRFICKMALAVGFSLFGQAYLATPQAAEARVGLRSKSQTQHKLHGSSTIYASQQFAKVAGYPGAVVILVIRMDGAYAMSVTVDQVLPLVVELCPDTLNSAFIDPELGYALVLFPQLHEYVELPLPELLAHVLGCSLNHDLAAIDEQRQSAIAFWKSLQPLAAENPNSA